MRIRMKRSALGSPDGVNVYNYEAGMNYAPSTPHQETGEYVASPLPLSHELASHFVTMGWAIDADNAQSKPMEDEPVEADDAAESAAEASPEVAPAAVELPSEPVEEAAASATDAPAEAESESEAPKA